MGDDTELEKAIKEILGKLAGAASMCWSPRPSGVFESELAVSFMQQSTNEIMRLLKNQDRKAVLAAQIVGHQEAMRPLLEEWSNIK